MPRTILLRRSALKALTYRILIVSLDFGAIYLLTGTLKIAVSFAIVSNIYTTIAYVLHERVWSRLSWGIRKAD